MKGVLAQVCHSTPIRTRLAILSQKGDRDFFARISHSLQDCPGVSAVETNALTGSVVMHHRGEQLPNILKHLNALSTVHLNLRLQPAVEPLARVFNKRLQLGLRHADRSLREMSGGQIDFATVAVTGLTGLALLQMLRGMLLPAGLTLFVMAFRIANGRAIKESNPEAGT